MCSVVPASGLALEKCCDAGLGSLRDSPHSGKSPRTGGQWELALRVPEQFVPQTAIPCARPALNAVATALQVDPSRSRIQLIRTTRPGLGLYNVARSAAELSIQRAAFGELSAKLINAVTGAGSGEVCRDMLSSRVSGIDPERGNFRERGKPRSGLRRSRQTFPEPDTRTAE